MSTGTALAETVELLRRAARPVLGDRDALAVDAAGLLVRLGVTCQPTHIGPYFRVPGPDGAERCLTCGEVTEQSPVVPSVGAVPVEVPEGDCWFGDDPKTVGTAAAANRVWCVQCADWTDQAVTHDTHHRRIAEGDLAGFAARVRAEERQRIAAEVEQPAFMQAAVDRAQLTHFTDDQGHDIGVMPGSHAAVAIIAARTVLAAGSAVPVATPASHFAITRHPDGSLTTAPGPMATPTESVDEVVCPNCEQTIRARMSDAPDNREALMAELGELLDEDDATSVANLLWRHGYLTKLAEQDGQR